MSASRGPAPRWCWGVHPSRAGVVKAVISSPESGRIAAHRRFTTKPTGGPQVQIFSGVWEFAAAAEALAQGWSTGAPPEQGGEARSCTDARDPSFRLPRQRGAVLRLLDGCRDRPRRRISAKASSRRHPHQQHRQVIAPRLELEHDHLLLVEAVPLEPAPGRGCAAPSPPSRPGCSSGSARRRATPAAPAWRAPCRGDRAAPRPRRRP